MNKAILVGRLAADPETRVSSDNQTTITRYTVACDRYGKDKKADFIKCVSFGASAEFAEKYFTKGMRVAVSGHIQTGSYTNKDGVKVYTTEVVVENHEFAQSRSENKEFESAGQEELPFGE